MKRFSYLTASILVLSLIVLGCSQDAPTASSEDGVVLQPNVREAENPVGAAGIPGLNCCPEGFDFAFVSGNPADRNGDDRVCQRVTAGGTITIDNNAAGDCCIPPDPCGGGGD